MKGYATKMEAPLKIAITSDLHYGITEPDKIQAMVRAMVDDKPDVIVLAGDIGEPLERFEAALDLFTRHSWTVSVIPGNHCLWRRNSHSSSKSLWEQFLPAATRKRGFIWLENDTIIRENVALVGTIAWYDYSSRAPEYELKSDEAFFSTKHMFNNDGKYIDWEWTDLQFARIVGEAFFERLDAVQANQAIDSIIVVTHVPIFPSQIVKVQRWSTRNEAYYGNYSLGKILEQYSKVKMVVSGHTHMPCRSEHLCPDGHLIQTAVVGSNYGYPTYDLIEVCNNTCRFIKKGC